VTLTVVTDIARDLTSDVGTLLARMPGHIDFLDKEINIILSGQKNSDLGKPQSNPTIREQQGFFF